MRLYTTPRFAPLPDTQRTNWPAVADELHANAPAAEAAPWLPIGGVS